jgi:hypothetical protein
MANHPKPSGKHERGEFESFTRLLDRLFGGEWDSESKPLLRALKLLIFDEAQNDRNAKYAVLKYKPSTVRQ